MTVRLTQRGDVRLYGGVDPAGEPQADSRQIAETP